jgi:hypothetical protein
LLFWQGQQRSAGRLLIFATQDTLTAVDLAPAAPADSL